MSTLVDESTYLSYFIYSLTFAPKKNLLAPEDARRKSKAVVATNKSKF